MDSISNSEALARHLCQRHGIAIKDPLLSHHETNLVFIAEDRWVVKFFDADAQRQFAVEATLLRQLTRERPLPAPRWIADGRIDGVDYVLMTRVSGQPLPSVWPSVPLPQRLSLARTIGHLLRRLHQMDPAPLRQVEEKHGGWREFCRQHGSQFRRDLATIDFLPVPLRRQIAAFLDTEAPAYIAAAPALIHADIGPGHIYLDKDGADWHLTGFIDFADAMLAPAEYEWTDGLLYLFPEDPALRWAVLAGYYATGGRPADLERRCLANLMHSYAGAHWIKEWHQREGEPALQTLQDLQDLLFPRRPALSASTTGPSFEKRHGEWRLPQ